MGLKCGIVGLPNVGKSTLFNSLMGSNVAEAANYPFCTIEPNIGLVAVPDKYLEELAKLAGSQKMLPAQMEFVDIAGLVKDAHKGEGLGNQFLSHIREVDCIIYVLRCFENSNVIHVDDRIDPIGDSEIIEMELILADIQSLSKRIPNIEKKAKNNKDIAEELSLIREVMAVLESGKAARYAVNETNAVQIKNLQLLTSKPFLYVCNVAEIDVVHGNKLSMQVESRAKEMGVGSILVSAQVESEIANLEDEGDKIAFLEDLGLEESGLNKLIRASYSALDLITFFTIGPKEARAWTVKDGVTAPQAAGVIHSDFERGFICAEVISCDDYLKYCSEAKIKEAGKMRLEGKEYKVKNRDVIHFRFNV